MVAAQSEPIAIIGAGCRFPGSASSPAALWKLLNSPTDVLKKIPKDRFDTEGYYHENGDHHGTSNVRHAYILDEDLTKFDANFFGIGGNEAEGMDPQQRLLLETVYEALEAGGQTIQALRGSDTAVYVGTMTGDHEGNLLRDPASFPTYFATGTSRAIHSNRVSYFFDWHGPSITMDTACSSSMIAVHNAVQVLRSGESTVAVACGSSLLLQPEMFIAESNLHMLSPHGRSRMWDAAANGYARGDGIASLVMKRLSDAVRDGDHIDCIIRETGTNQDGRTKGITVPSSEAQAALIRKTYARAGLDYTKPEGRPQFFEAHGTGTKVGDPREANAIHSCFGGPQNNDPLYVGSIKTVIGHTEGCAGAAGLLKASLSLQAGVIPPNLLFNTLNPDIEPFIEGLQVPTQAFSWPALPDGVPRRASVNSFGFGGANAHAILEAYQPDMVAESQALPANIPFLFSAASNTSLVENLKVFVEYLRGNSVSPRNLAWTLQHRRSIFPNKVAFSARNLEGLTQKIESRLDEYVKKSESAIGVRTNSTTLKILGVFTGQGAQWPEMGAGLYRSSEFVRKRVQELDESLSILPDGPSWTLAEQMLLSADKSRVAEAAISQPLCTAVQVVLVDLLRTAGITFQAVVGHSSGEITAAYAAGFISAQDAIRIAYYRGLFAKLAAGSEGQKGAMLAAGTSLEDALEITESDQFKGRVSVAAHNSPASVTLSGDAEAIEGVKKLLEEEKKFARLLKVDTAYHSHHMLACSDAYVQAMRACKVTINWDRDHSCTWYSSVRPGEPMSPTQILEDLYWRDNMVNRVSFAEAVMAAVDNESFTIAVEVGPHAALKGPALQSMSEKGTMLPYTGVMSRGQDDIESLSNGLGYLWAQHSSDEIDFSAFDRLFDDYALPKLSTGLPTYQWDKKVCWQESRVSRRARTKDATFHELLGTPHADNTEFERRWSNILKISEVPWLAGHTLQGQQIFPAAGYASMAFEATKEMIDNKSVKAIELRNFVIGKAISLGDVGAETLVTLTNISPIQKGQIQTAEFAVYSAAHKSAGDLEVNATGSLRIVFGEASESLLSPITVDSNLNEQDADRFYSSLANVGYEYADDFRTMSQLKRKLNQSSAMISSFDYGTNDKNLMIHPALLDVAFQAGILAYAGPDDGRLWSLYVPTFFECIRINPALCDSVPAHSVQLPVRARLLSPPSSSIDSIHANIDILNENAEHTMVQVHGAAVVPLTVATVSDDRTVFSRTQLDVVIPHGESLLGHMSPSANEVELGSLLERLSFFYYRQWMKEIHTLEWSEAEPHFQQLRDSINQTLSLVDAEKHPYIKKQWRADSLGELTALLRPHSRSVDVRLLRAVGENLPAAVRRETTMIEHMKADGLLEEYKQSGLGLETYNSALGKMVAQFVHVQPRARILEVGAGLGSATQSVLQTIGQTFTSYTFTDISDDQFETAASLLDVWKEKLTFKVFDPEATPESQGFEEQYDLIVASNVLHNSPSLETALKNVRQLLKPGGFLMLLEITNNKVASFTAKFGGLPEWWTGSDDNRQYVPTIGLPAWHNILRQAGFSGVDTVTPVGDALTWPFSVFATQAIDDRVNHLRKPLSRSSVAVPIPHLTIIGSNSLEVSKIAEDLADIADMHCDEIQVFTDIKSARDRFTEGQTVICLADLADPTFADLTSETFECLQSMLAHSRNLLWVARDAKGHPYQYAMVGFLRAVLHEMPDLAMQHLDIGSIQEGASKVILESAIRLHALSHWEGSGDLKQQLVYSKETELILENGILKAPRVRPDDLRNSRMNSQRRPLTRPASSATEVISISATASGAPCLRDEPYVSKSRDGRQASKAVLSTLPALKVAPGNYLFLTIGHEVDSAAATVALSSSNSSEYYPVASAPITQTQHLAGLLSTIAAELLASSILSAVSAGAKILVHEPSAGFEAGLASALRSQAATRQVELHFSTSKADNDASWFRLSPWMQKDAIKSHLPSGITNFVDFAADDESKEVAMLIRESLPKAHQYTSTEDYWRSVSSKAAASPESLTDTLFKATTNAQQHEIGSIIESITPTQLAKLPSYPETLTLVDWSIEETVSIQVQPLNPKPLFSSNKSYLLVGSTGSVGQSLCEYMIRNGARNVFLTSRRPQVSQDWLDSFSAIGAKVAVYKMDVTNKESVIQVVDEIQTHYPPIMGVANAAMVLNDTAFSNMSFEKMSEVLAPKITGTNHLDEVFYSTKLDFFVVFSSASAVVGIFGQSGYAAACCYMSSLVRRRRSRGLAGSAFDIGRLAGIGYIERVSSSVKGAIDKQVLMPLSEWDLHQMFTETVFAGQPEMNLEPVVTTGIEHISTTHANPPPFLFYPRLSHYFIDTQTIQTGAGSTQARAADQLLEATSAKQVIEIIKESFAAKLQIALQLSEEAVDTDIPIAALGIDSLVAVEVRAWFLRELKTDVPVLKILGGGSISDLAEQASQKLPAEMVPLLGAAPDKAKEEARPVDPPQRPVLLQADSDTPTIATTATLSSAGSANTPLTLSSKSSMSDLNSIPELKEPEAAVKVSRQSPMSLSQSRFWLLDQFLEDSTASNVVFGYQVDGELKIERLSKAVDKIVSRHESLRTFFASEASKPDVVLQKVAESSHVKLEQKKIQSIDEATQEFEAMKSHEFDLGRPELLRILVLTLSNSINYLLIAYHHIISDGASMQILLSDLEKAYDGRPLGPPPMQFIDFSARQQKSIRTGGLNSELQYWRDLFQDPPSVLPLLPMAIKNARTPIAAFKSNVIMRRLSSGIGSSVREVAKASRATNFHVYLTVFQILLARLAGIADLTIGIADANRTEDDTTQTVGLFLNLLPLRFKPSTTQTFTKNVSETRNQVYSALANSKLPFDLMLQEFHHVERSTTHAPFFQAFFDYKVGVQKEQRFSSLHLDLKHNMGGETNYDINVTVVEDAQGPIILMETQASLYDHRGTELLLDSYTTLLDAFVKTPQLKMADAPIHSQLQLEGVTEIGKGPDMEQKWPDTVSRRIEQVAATHKQAVAVRDGDGNALTYDALMRRSQAIAARLQQMGVGPGGRIVVFQEPSVDWICSLLAILRSGCAYVPLDINNPAARLAKICDACRPQAVLSDAAKWAQVESLQAGNVPKLNVSEVGQSSARAVPDRSSPELPAVIIYTSGSTGTPKGIVVKNLGLRNYFEGSIQQYKFNSPQNCLQQSTLSFDISLEQIFTALTTGGMLYMASMHQRGDPQRLVEAIRDFNIAYTQATPSEYLLWLQYGSETLRQCTSWKFAMAGGEKLTSAVVRQFATLNIPDLRLLNGYGPGETTCGSSFYDIDYSSVSDGDRIPIGFQYPNYTAYILDENLKPLPIGMPGEIVIAGAGVAGGYINNDKLTKSQFVPNRFASKFYIANGWTMMYRTGDRGHFRSDGALIFHSRVSSDLQVKIRGLRIELGDIESNILHTANGAIQEAVVTVRGTEANAPFLAAHVVFSTEHKIADKHSYLQGLMQELPVPRYMIPAMTIPVAALPRNYHGKVDRKAIAQLQLPEQHTQPLAGDKLSPTETQVWLLWQEALSEQRPDVGITPSTTFFAVGGNSLLIVKLQSRIREVLNVVVPIFKLMDNVSLGEMARVIEEHIPVEAIDWEQETAITISAPQATEQYSEPKSQPKVVVVTGATGFLGRQILKNLTNNADIDKVHCIAVRNKSSDAAQMIKGLSSKVTIHDGDLSDLFLGLTGAEFQELSQTADAIIHLGATRSFWDNYHVLRQTNVLSTKELVQLAAPRRIPIHFVSTAGVLPANFNQQNNVAASVAADKPATDGANGYISSKWAGEQILENASKQLNVPVTIHRYMPYSESGTNGAAPVLEWMTKHSEAHKLIPDLSGWTGTIDFMENDKATSAICAALVTGSRDRNARFVHHESTIRLDETHLASLLENQKEKNDLEKMDVLDWFGRIKQDGLEYFLTSFAATVSAAGEGAEQGLTVRR